MVSARQLTPKGGEGPLAVEDYAWSPDSRKLLVFTNTQPVWRLNTRGDYWVLDRTTGALRQLGGASAKPSTLMFAKFSPDGGRVAYVRENNLYVEDLASGAITAADDGRLPDADQRHLRLGVRRGADELLRRRLALESRRPEHRVLAAQRGPGEELQPGQQHRLALLTGDPGPVSQGGRGELRGAGRDRAAPRAAPTRWLDIAGDPREHYIPRMDWAAGSDEVIVQRLNRLQNTHEVMLGDARTGEVRTVLTEQDSTWVDVVDDLVWLNGGQEFTWVSERDGWKHVYAVSRDGKSVRLVTKGDFDVVEVEGIDDKGGWLYYVASPDNPAQKYLFRARLDGKGGRERLSPGDRAGTHAYDRAPELQVRHRDLLEPRQPARRPAGPAAGQPGHSHPGGQRAGCARGSPGCDGRSRVAVASRRRTAPRCRGC